MQAGTLTRISFRWSPFEYGQSAAIRIMYNVEIGRQISEIGGLIVFAPNEFLDGSDDAPIVVPRGVNGSACPCVDAMSHVRIVEDHRTGR